MSKVFTYANGLNISQSRRLALFCFGDFFVRADKNDERKRFDIYLLDKRMSRTRGKGKSELIFLKDECNVEYFLDFWNKAKKNINNKKEGFFNIIILEQKI